MNIKFGKIIEGFSILPSINVNWMRTDKKTYYDLQFTWMFWYIIVGQISKFLKTQGY